MVTKGKTADAESSKKLGIDWKSILSGVIGALLTALIFWLLGYLGSSYTKVLVPSAAVVAFDSEKCPEGWTAVNQARGRYIVGLTVGGRLGQVKGTELSDLEDRPAGQHTHPFESQVLGSSGGDIAWGGSAARSQSKGVTGLNAGIAGTNAPYIQYLWCRKD